MNVEKARFNMIEQQIRPWDVPDPSVLDLLAAVRREDFLPPALRALAFVDTDVPLPGGGTLLSPKVQARMLLAAAPARSDQVLEIGAGCGYMAALLAHKSSHVTAFESRPALAALARDNLRRAAVFNADVIEGSGAAGDAEGAPYGVIMLSGSVAEVPQALLLQLRVGGRLVAVVGDEPVMRATLFVRAGEQQWNRSVLFDTVAPRLPGFPEPSRFHF